MTNEKLASEPIGQLLFKMALPAITAQLVNMLYNIIDRIYIGHLPNIGPVALTGVGICFPIIILITSFTSLASMGGAPQAAIKLGEGDKASAERIMANSFSLILIFATVLAPLFFWQGNRLLMWFGASSETIVYGSQYLKIYLMGIYFGMISIGMNAFLTTQGYTGLAMRTVLFGAILNIILDPILMFGLKLNVRGAALATIISQAASCGWVMRYLISGKLPLRLKFTNLRLNRVFVPAILALGFSPFVMQSTESLVGISLNYSLQKYGGDLAVGAMTILSSIMQILSLPLIGIAQGAQPIISYNYGARLIGRCRRAMRLYLQSSIIYALLFFLVLMIAPDWPIRLFTSDSELIRFGSWAARIFMAGTFGIGAQIACQYSFLSLGQAKVSSRLAMLRKLILLIPLIYILPLLLNNQVFAIYLAEPIADILAAGVTVLTFWRVIPQILAHREQDL